MTLFYDETTGTVISRFAQFEVDQDVKQVVSRSLDGTLYIQTIGSAAINYEGTVYVDRAGRLALLSAQERVDLCRVDLPRGSYYGRITGLSFGNRMVGDYFAATVTLAKEVTA